MAKKIKRLIKAYMVRVDSETGTELEDLAKELKRPPTSVARMLIEFGLNRKDEFRDRVKL